MSLRARLLLATMLVTLTALVVAGVATYTVFSRSQLRQVDDTLQRTHEPIESAVAAEQGELINARGKIAGLAPGSFVAVQDPGGDLELSIPAREPGHDELTVDLTGLKAPDDQTLSQDRPIGVDLPGYLTVSAISSHTQLRLRVARLADGRVLFIGESLHDAAESARRLLLIEVIVAAIALIVAGLVGWFMVRIGLRPLQRVERTALLIAAAGDLDHDVPGADRQNEMGQLALALNTMLERIRGAFAERDSTEEELRESEERMRRFVADVSHELRTPLAAVSAYTELFERGARDRPEDLARAMRGINVETGRMHELVEELLLLARLDEGRPLARRQVDVSEIVVEAIAAARAVSSAWPIALKVSDVVTVDGDAGRLRQVVDNLLTNVRTHTPAGTKTAIVLAATATSATITIEDDGPGMSPEQAAHIFERFYRADASRSRSSGGSGLGMAIVHAIVEAHGGTIEVRSANSAGLRITIELPLHAVADSLVDA